MRTIARAPEWVLGAAPKGGHMWVPLGAANLVPRINTVTGVIDGTTSASNMPQAIAWDGGSYMYMAEGASQLVQRVDVGSHSLGSTVNIGSHPISLTHALTYMYVVGDGHTLTRIAIASGSISGAAITFSGGDGVPNRVAWDGSQYLYVTSNNSGPSINQLLKVDSSSWGSYSEVTLPSPYPTNVAWDGGSFLYIPANNNAVIRVSVATGLIDKTLIIGQPLNTAQILWDGSTHIYVTCSSGYVATIDTTTGTVDGYIQVGSGPDGLAKDGSGNVYVSNYGGNSISKISISTRAVTATLTGISQPSGLAWDGGSYIWVVNATSSGSVTLVSVSSFTVATTVTLSPTAYVPQAIAWDGGSYMYVTQPFNNNVYRVAIAAGHAQNVISGFNTTGSSMSVVWDGLAHMYFNNNGNGTVSTVPIVTGTAIDQTYTVGSYPFGLTHDGTGNVYVANENACTLSRINPYQGYVDQTTPVANDFEGVAWDGSNHMYVTNAAMSQVHRVNSSGVVDLTIPVGQAPKRIAWDGSNHMYVTNSADGTVSTISTATGQIDGAPITVGTTPDEIAWDGSNHMYVNNKGSNNVTRILKGYSLNIVSQFTLSDYGKSVLDGSGHLYFAWNTGSASGITRVSVATGLVDATISLTYPINPEVIAWDGGSYIYTVMTDPNFPYHTFIYRINITTLAVTSIDLGATDHIYAMAWDQGLYMYAATRDQVFRITVSTGAVGSPITLTIPSVSVFIEYIAWDGGSYMYIGVGDDSYDGFNHGYIQRILISSFTVDGTTLSVPGAPVGLAWDHGSYMYAANYDGYGALNPNTVSRIRVSDFTVHDGIVLTYQDPEYIAWGGGSLMYVVGEDTQPAIYAIDIASGTLVQTLTGFGSDLLYHLVWDGVNHLYVPTYTGKVYVVAITAGSVDATISTAGVPGGIAWDGPLR